MPSSSAIEAPLTEARQGNDVGAVAADRRPVALGVLDQLVGFGDPESAAVAFEPVVENHAGDLAALAGAGAVAEEPAAAETHRVRGIGRRGHDDVERLVDGIRTREMIAVRLAVIDDALELRVGEDPRGKQARRRVRPIARMRRRDRGHGGRLHQLSGMSLGIRNPDCLQLIALVEAGAVRRRRGRAFHEGACTRSLEGIVSKRVVRVVLVPGWSNPRHRYTANRWATLPYHPLARPRGGGGGPKVKRGGACKFLTSRGSCLGPSRS
jgi:hypothetical protein